MSRDSVTVVEAVNPTSEVDCEALGIGPHGNKLTRETTQIGGRNLADVAEVKNAAPAATDYGLVVRVLLYDASGNPAVITASRLQVDVGTAVAQDATLTGGAQKAIIRGGAKGATAAADVTGTAEGADHQALDTQLYHGGAAIDPRAIRALTSTDVVTLAAGGTIDITDRDARLVGRVKHLDSAGALIDPALKGQLPGALVSGRLDVNLGAAPAAIDVSDRAARALGQVVGDVASGSADSGNPVKQGFKALGNVSALPAAVADAQRVNALADEFGRQRIIINRPKLLGVYYVHSGRLTVLAAAHGATAGFFWIINPVGSAVLVYVKALRAQFSSTAVTAFASAPRVTVELVTFTGAPSGATIAYAKRDSNDAAPVSTLRTASTGLTLTAGNAIAGWICPCVMTAAGISVPVEQYTVDVHDDDDLVVLRAGQGIVVRQPDAGTASDTRLLTVDAKIEER